MIKLDTIPDLAKAMGGLAGHFRKAAAHHEAMAGKHDELAKANHALHEFSKGKADGMADDHEMKAHVEKCAACAKAAGDGHAAMAEMHKAEGARCAGMADGMESEKAAGGTSTAKTATGTVDNPATAGGTLEKTAAEKAAETAAAAADATTTEKAAGDAINGMVEKAMTAVLAKALETIQTSGKIEQMVEEVVMKRVAEKLGSVVVPTGARGVMEKANPSLIVRPGGPTPPAEEKSAPELAHVFGE